MEKAGGGTKFGIKQQKQRNLEDVGNVPDKTNKRMGGIISSQCENLISPDYSRVQS